MGSQGGYEVVCKLARGGMAEIFLARTLGPEGFEKVVVLKKILPLHAEDPTFVRLFLDEAKLAATLDHPHIAQVYELGKLDGDYCFTMEFVHGQDVRTLLQRTSRTGGQVPIAHAVHVARDVAAALHYAHERRQKGGELVGIVHRDVSPSNILISYEGIVKLVDFGVAKAATSSTRTRTGALKGKIAYMSPEQAAGAPIDRRSDIFSLGIVLWEMVATRRLFKAENDLATLQKIITSDPPPPSQLRAECPPELERIILRALARDLDARYQTAEELQLDLEALAREHKLDQSSVALRSSMQALFHGELDAWKIAQSDGKTLSDHLTSAGTAEPDEEDSGVTEASPAVHEQETRLLRFTPMRPATPSVTAPPRRKVPIALVAGGVAIAAIVFAVLASGGDRAPQAASSSAPTNAPIAPPAEAPGSAAARDAAVVEPAHPDAEPIAESKPSPVARPKPKVRVSKPSPVPAPTAPPKSTAELAPPPPPPKKNQEPELPPP